MHFVFISNIIIDPRGIPKRVFLPSSLWSLCGLWESSFKTTPNGFSTNAQIHGLPISRGLNQVALLPEKWLKKSGTLARKPEVWLI